MLIFVVFLFLLLVGGLIWNAGRDLFFWLKSFRQNLSPVIFFIFYLFFSILILALFALSRIPNFPLPHIIFKIAHYLLGFWLYFILFANINRLIFFILDFFRPSFSQTIRRISGFIVILLTVGISLYGVLHALDTQKKHYTVHIAHTEQFTLKLTVVSDIHLGFAIDDGRIEKLVQEINKTDADLVCIVGDVFDGDFYALSDPEKIKQSFLEIKSSYGVYACLGNHDAGDTYKQMIDFLESANIQVLLDEATVIDNRLVLAGRKDSSPIGKQGEKRQPLSLPEGSENLPLIVMDHQPTNRQEYASETALIISGHTHNGQLFPFNIVTSLMHDACYGYYPSKNKKPPIIVSSGYGSWGPPMRVGSDSEIVTVSLVFSETEQ